MNPPPKIFFVPQIKEADKFTIQHEPISSIDLMERAASACAKWITEHFSKQETCIIVCGNGNNGGDGLSIARQLHHSGYKVQAYIIETNGKYTDDFLANRERLEQIDKSLVKQILSLSDLTIKAGDIVIDALFGTGLSKPVNGLAAAIITLINNSGAKIISIDMPSGLFADKHTDASSPVIKAVHTLSFQFPKLAFFFPENEIYTGDWRILNIGLSETFIAKEPAANYQLTPAFIQALLKPRKKFSHKGTYGHAMMIAGSYGKIGAAILAARACLRSGPGLLTVHLPQCGHDIMQAANPEAMVSPDTKKQWVGDEILTKTFSAVGIGPGLGTNEQTQKALHYIITRNERPLVIDADALNILGMHKDWLEQLPVNSILTPHPKEFERLAGTTSSDFERHELQITFSKKYKLFIILKGAHTCITTPSGESYFNTTGNPGMARGGSGDILTGILTGILAQGYSPLETCLIGVFVHGFAGDLACELLGQTGMIAGDICDHLPAAFKQLYQQAS
ncbi:MAG: NAD(P)H-hydrate dehydratase [Bacteroidota bacterium]